MAEHIHKYQLIKLGRNKHKAYRCMLENCNHYIYPEFLEGKRCICYICGKDFIITPYAAKLKRPHCDNCVAKGENKTAIKDVAERKTEDLLLNFRERFQL